MPFAPATGFAQDDRDARLVVAKEYVTSAVADMDMPRVIEQMGQPLVQQIEASTGTALNPAQLEKINVLYQETYGAKMAADHGIGAVHQARHHAGTTGDYRDPVTDSTLRTDRAARIPGASRP